MLRRWGWASLWLLVMGACGEGAPSDSQPVAPPRAAAPTGAAHGEAPARSSAESEPSPQSSPQSAEVLPSPARVTPSVRARVRELVRRARRAAHSGDSSAAVTHFRGALGLAPRDPRLHCELGYLLRVERPESARRHLDRGLSLYGDPYDLPEPMRAPAAMCLYNLGRLLEQGDEEDRFEAQTYYEDSLALRDNATVRARLAALDPDGAPATSIPLLREADAIEAWLGAERECDEGELDEDADGRCASSVRRLGDSGARGDLPAVVWFETHTLSDMIDEAAYVVGVQRAGAYVLVDAAEHTEDNTDHGHSGEGTVRPGEVSRLANGWLRIDFEETFAETAEGMGELEGEGAAGCWTTFGTTDRAQRALLCDFAAAPRCVLVTLASQTTHFSEASCPSGTPQEVVDSLQRPPRVTRWRVALDVDGARLRLRTLEAAPSNRALGPAHDVWLPTDAFVDEADAVWLR